MKIFYLLNFFFLINFLSLSQSLEVYRIDSKSGEIVYSQPTKVGKKYIITIEGTYHQWAKTSNKGFGVDAVWYNDIPNFGNTLLDTYLEELFKNPIWLGDEKVFTVPTILPILNGFKFGLKKYTGFRINGEPIPQIPIDTISHRYQVEKLGNGAPFYFQILDSVLNFATEKVEPRYEDNTGSLLVTIQELKDTNAIICGFEIKEVDENIVQMILSAKLLVKDSNSVSGEKNIFYDLKQIGIIENGEFICPDSLVCNKLLNYPIAMGLVLDRSASMEEPINDKDLFTTRIDAMKNASKEIINKLNYHNNIKDSCLIISFSNSIKLEQDWTDNKDELIKSIEKIYPDSATAFYTALLYGLEKLSKHNHPKKALISLTDGENTIGPIWGKECISTISKKYSDIQIYLIGLSLLNTEKEMFAIDTMKEIVKQVKKGNFFKINQKDSLNLIYKNISNELLYDDCCSIYFTSKVCNGKSDTNKYKILFVSGDNLITINFEVKCKSKQITNINESSENNNDNGNYNISPNPADYYTKLQILSNGEEINIKIIDLFGNEYYNLTKYYEIGNHIKYLDTQFLPNGSYLVLINSKYKLDYQKLIIIR